MKFTPRIPTNPQTYADLEEDYNDIEKQEDDMTYSEKKNNRENSTYWTRNGKA